MIRKISTYLLLLLITMILSGHAQVISGYSLTVTDPDRSGLLGNGITDILYKSNALYIGTGFGLTISADNGDTWTNYDEEALTGENHSAQRGGVSAIDIAPDGTIWVAVAYDTLVDESETPLSIGGGLRFLEPGSSQWQYISQPVDALTDTAGGMRPTTTRVQNLSFDLAVSDSQIWIASFGGGVRRSADRGASWDVITTDGKPFDAGNNDNLNHRGFAALIDTAGTIWIGTAGGISSSTDGGESWERFTYTSQNFPISGNWCIGLFHNPWDNSVWATTLRTTDQEEFNAISKTTNQGATWDIHLADELSDGTFPRYVAFYDSAVYVATEKGIYKSINNGDTWFKFPMIRDNVSGESLFTSTFFSAGTSPGESGNHRLWVGSADGLAATENNGFDWIIFRAFVSTRERTDPAVYAYPNPFSPLHSDRPCRFQFDIDAASTVTIELYNFAMEKVATLSENQAAPVGGSFDRSIIWDGTDHNGRLVDNGVYFFRAQVGSETTWGKIAIVN